MVPKMKYVKKVGQSHKLIMSHCSLVNYNMIFCTKYQLQNRQPNFHPFASIGKNQLCFDCTILKYPGCIAVCGFEYKYNNMIYQSRIYHGMEHNAKGRKLKTLFRLWTQKRHHIPWHQMQPMGCLSSWVLWRKDTMRNQKSKYHNFGIKV